ncbi:MAG: RNA polymerase sigma-54 factor, partial [Proteobacteria bacterium]
MEIKQQLRLSQQLVMTPQLQQAIRILQLNRLELQEELRKEMDGNPLLVDDSIDPQGRAGLEKTDLGTGNERGEGMIDRMEERSRASGDDPVGPTDTKAVKDIDWEQFLENRSQQQSGSGTGTRNGYEDLPPIEATLTKAASLVDHLNWQIQMSDLTETERAFAELVLGNLDEQGYLDLKGMTREDGTVV